MSESKNLYFRIKRKFEKSGYKQVQCESCGELWSPIIRIGGRLPNNWWICPICKNGE
jgi:hypothetical protein